METEREAAHSIQTLLCPTSTLCVQNKVMLSSTEYSLNEVISLY